ncbi:MAG TPA: RagB/SusD family nutrient uptake outer membrane protein [Bacteroidales bacterium]|nr:RagB/SusD family nutrient uptake outer membrane protein [Bacteroidales bacterium]
MKYILSGLFLSILMFASCTKDLDVTPKDPNRILTGNLNDDPLYMQMVLGKIYASFIIPGQGGNNDQGMGEDITASDPNFFTTMRALWNLQELPTDEAICAWGDVGIADLNTQTWSPNNPFLTALYQRLSLSITYANDFIRITNGNSDPSVVKYNAEARFLRALAYYWAIDLFGKFPYTTEADKVGKFFPKIGSRSELFTYIESELLAIENLLDAPKTYSTQANQAACWMLLARLYLNAEVFTGTARWADCKTYCDKVIGSGYTLAPNYRQNFSADNDGSRNPEMIFGWEQDGVYTQGYVGTTFIIESSSDATYVRAERFHGLTSNTNWNGNRTKRTLTNILVDTIATYGNNPVPTSDSMFLQAKDKRVYLKTKKSWDIPSPSSSGDYGIGVYKFTARNADGSQANHYNPAYASTDFPIFRLAEAYLMRAEAFYRQNDKANAVLDINTVRRRAYGNNSGDITEAKLTDKFLLDELAREFYYEGHRRTDLVRFGQFTSGTYVWEWKGNEPKGRSTSSHMNIYPIPAAEVAANPNYNGQNNAGY